MRWFDGITISMDMSLSKPWEMLKDRDARHAAVHGVIKSQTEQKQSLMNTDVKILNKILANTI